MLHIDKVILVEGKYDKIRLQSVTDAVVIPLNGFSAFSARVEAEIRTLAADRGVIILTDSDRAGFAIRGHLSSILPPDKIFNAYIPDIYGKEKRKTEASKEGKLGVEGLSTETLTQVLAPFASDAADREERAAFTKSDLMEAGIYGGPGSAEKRRAFLRAAGLPERLGANALLKYMNAFMGREEFEGLV